MHGHHFPPFLLGSCIRSNSVLWYHTALNGPDCLPVALQNCPKNGHIMQQFNLVNNKECSWSVQSVDGQLFAQAQLALGHFITICFSSQRGFASNLSCRVFIFSFPWSLPSYLFPLICQCDRCLVPWHGGSWQCRFSNHGGTILSMAWLPKEEASGCPRQLISIVSNTGVNSQWNFTSAVVPHLLAGSILRIFSNISGSE